MTNYRVVAHRDLAVDCYPLAEDLSQWRVGRAAECEIRLSDPAVSRQHVLIRRVGEGFEFEDLGSSNPVMQAGRRVARGVFSPSTPILVGATQLYLDPIARDATVRLVDQDPATPTRTRRYLDSAARIRPEVTGVTPPAVHIAELLANFVLAEHENTPPRALATHLLDLGMSWLRFERGVLGEFVGREFEVLASRSRDTTDVLSLARSALDELRIRGHAFLQPADGGSVLAIPLGEPIAGALVLSRPQTGVSLDDQLLRTAAVLGAAMWARLIEQRRLHQMRQQLGAVRTATEPTLLASSRLSAVCNDLALAARHGLSVFLVGEDGTEKLELARYLHAASTRAAGPLVAFHARVVPAERAMDELFGSERPAMLRSHDTSRALLRAQGGTLFLDEPELLPEAVQERLAHCLHTKTIAVPGQDDTVALDVRVVAASTQDPLQPGDGGARLVPALAQELSAIRIDVPPLRSVPADIETLIDLLLMELPPAPDGLAPTITEAARQTLLACAWPGNVRQLRRALEIAATRAGNKPIQPRDLPADVHEARPAIASLAEVERAHILQVLAAVGNVKSKAAEVLGIAPSTLYERLKRYNIR